MLNHNSTLFNEGGEYTFGGYDSSKVGGKLTTVPVDNSQGLHFMNLLRIVFMEEIPVFIKQKKLSNPWNRFLGHHRF